jgi:hypothetical protein
MLEVHTNPAPSQSSIPKVTFPFPETPMPNHDWSGIHDIRIQTKLVIKQHTAYYMAKGKRSLTERTTVQCTHTHTPVNQAEGTASLRS